LHFPVLQPLRQLQWICPWPPYKESNCTAFLTLISVLSGTSKIVNSFPWIFSIWFRLKSPLITPTQGRIQDFKLGGAHLKYCAELREARKILGYFVWKITILRKKILFFPILGGARAGCPPPWIRPCNCCTNFVSIYSFVYNDSSNVSTVYPWLWGWHGLPCTSLSSGQGSFNSVMIFAVNSLPLSLCKMCGAPSSRKMSVSWYATSAALFDFNRRIYTKLC
jgi:hypothetical protein